MKDSNTELQSTLNAIAQLKQSISTSPGLNLIEKATVEVPVKRLKAELQKPQPDQSIVDAYAIAALKKGLDSAITLGRILTNPALNQNADGFHLAHCRND